jgi:hypothetical protein
LWGIGKTSLSNESNNKIIEGRHYSSGLPDGHASGILLRKTINMFRGFMVDIKRGSFGAPALVVSDFQAKAQKTLGPIKKAAPNGWYILNLTPGKNFVNKLASGNAPAANRPQLIVEYYVP